MLKLASPESRQYAASHAGISDRNLGALEALRDGWTQRKLTMDALRHYATIDRVANVMRPYLESVTA